MELVPRSGQELYEMTCLVGELLPPLPGDGVFAVDGLLAPPGTRLRDGLANCPSILPRNAKRAVINFSVQKSAKLLGLSRKWLFLLTRNSQVAGSTKIRIITRNYGVIKPSYA